VQQEISRRTPLGQQAAAAIARTATWRPADQFLLALMRKWFWARKPDAGFLLEGFPATLLQAMVFDEWLEARGENLTAVLPAPGPAGDDSVATHYRTQGLLPESRRTAA
jgi:adenylate kinase